MDYGCFFLTGIGLTSAPFKLKTSLIRLYEYIIQLLAITHRKEKNAFYFFIFFIKIFEIHPSMKGTKPND